MSNMTRAIGLLIPMTEGEDSMKSKQKRAAMYTRSAASQEPGEENNALATQIRLCKMYCQVQEYTTDEKHIY
jgi:hypothetical protein